MMTPDHRRDVLAQLGIEQLPPLAVSEKEPMSDDDWESPFPAPAMRTRGVSLSPFAGHRRGC